MDTISSAEFRKTYAKLTKTTIVTVNGHPIGEWRPTGDTSAFEELIKSGGVRVPFELDPTHEPNVVGYSEERYDVRPIRPVPKTRK
jgi:hypothetical protein